jgi:thiol-disulfide isomerase/thioredoxin
MMNLYRKVVSVMLCGLIGIAGGCSNTSSDSKPEPQGNSEAVDVSKAKEETPAAATKKEDAEPKTPAEIPLTIATWEEVEQQVATHAGKVVVLDLWSTSCQPCIREFPNLVALHKKFPDRVVCMSVNSDYFGTKSKPPEYFVERVTTFLTEQNATFDNYLCSVSSDELYAQLNLASIPAVLVYGTDGKLVNRFDNDEGKYGDEFTYPDHVIPLVEQLLQETAGAAQGGQ